MDIEGVHTAPERMYEQESALILLRYSIVSDIEVLL